MQVHPRIDAAFRVACQHLPTLTCLGVMGCQHAFCTNIMSSDGCQGITLACWMPLCTGHRGFARVQGCGVEPRRRKPPLHPSTGPC